MNYVRKVPDSVFGTSSFCAGCGHGVAIRLICEVLEEMGLSENAICALSVGCSCNANLVFGVNRLGCAHGRAAASACGIKRCRPDHLVFTYQGDGDAISIGFSETVYAAQRNENITAIVINNGVYGMTGGQASPTTLIGQKTVTTVNGRSESANGLPVNILGILSQFPNVAYLARGSVHDAASIIKTKRYIRNAFEKQLAGEGYSCVEILSPCPTNWHLSPVDSVKRIDEIVTEVYPIGEFVKKGE